MNYAPLRPLVKMHVNQLIMSSDKGGTKIVFLERVFDKVKINLHMLSLIMLHRIMSNTNGGFVVTIETHKSLYVKSHFR